ncbi:hypothetical protein ABE10_13190, partial [Bacillus toyonensis]|nr:hypothetical protein [Bacillus toyonensis]
RMGYLLLGEATLAAEAADRRSEPIGGGTAKASMLVLVKSRHGHTVTEPMRSGCHWHGRSSEARTAE